VEQYIHEFEQLQIRSGVEEEPEQAIARFLRGLELSIAEKVDIQPYWSFEDVCKLAIKLAKHSKRKGLFDHSDTKPAAPVNLNTSSRLEPTPKEVGGRDKGKDIVIEFPKQLDGKICFKCQGYDHFQANCPNIRVLTLKEIQKIDHFALEVAEEEEEGVDMILAPDVGELLVLQRILHAKESSEEEGQREHIFHSKCTIEGKVCSTIIDGGSCTNVSSTQLLSKFSLPTVLHP